MTITYTPLDITKLGGGEVVTGISVGSKESEPLSNIPQKVSIETAYEHTPNPEVSSYINNRQDNVLISPELQGLGISSVNSTKFNSFETVTLPLSDEKIKEGLKRPVWDSFRWLAELTKAIFLRRVRTT